MLATETAPPRDANPGGAPHAHRVAIADRDSGFVQRVRGLRLGADAWVTKPCHPEELVCVVGAVLRRNRRAELLPLQEPLLAGELSIRPDRYQAYVDDQSADLTAREFQLLLLLAQNDRVLERDEIYERVWGYAMAHGDRSVDVFVRKLRQKLHAASPGWTYIHTHFGIGYRFAPEPVAVRKQKKTVRAADRTGHSAAPDRTGHSAAADRTGHNAAAARGEVVAALS
jgi:DNA-binding winged helix-turn-helix (wHTH) protein